MRNRAQGPPFDMVAVGYTAVDYIGVIPRFPEEDLKLELESLEVQGGGPAATAAVTGSRLGLRTAFAGKVGDDRFGSLMLEGLEGEGVDVSSVVIEKGASSQFAFIMVEPATANRTILWTRGSVTPMSPGEVDAGMLEGCRALLIDTLEPAAALEAAKTARAGGALVVIDAGTLREGVAGLLPHCDYIAASETFAGQIAPGGRVEDALERIMEYGPRAAIVTLGERGCAALAGEEVMYFDGFDAGAIDTTGAGDVFHGALVFAALQGWDLPRCCVFSNAVAALKCRRPGGRAGIPDLDEALSFLGERVRGMDFRTTGRRS